MMCQPQEPEVRVAMIHPDLCAQYDRNYGRGLVHYRRVHAGSSLTQLVACRHAIDHHPDTGEPLERGWRNIHDRAWHDAERSVLDEMIQSTAEQTAEDGT